MNLNLSLCLLLVSISLASNSLGQASPPINQNKPQFEAIFPQLFSRYTGSNGYEDLVLAGDLIRSSPAQGHQENIVTLTQKRLVVQDEKISRAIQMVHEAVQKPIINPRDLGKIDENTTFKEFSLFRNMARVMAMKEYVLLSDGYVSSAIDIMFDGLKLANGTQKGTLIAGLVGIAIDAIMLQPIAKHFDQLSVRNCDQILGAVRQALEWDSGALQMFNVEQALNLKNVEAMRDKAKLDEFLKTSFDKPNQPSAEELLENAENQPLRDQAARSQEALNSLIDGAIALSKKQYALARANLELPYFKRAKITEPDPNSSLAALLYSKSYFKMTNAMNKYTQFEAMLHLLGTHASIMKYKWNHDALPGSLKDLQTDRLYAPEILSDPFTGKPLIYKLIGKQYDLSSAGADGEGYYLPFRKKTL